MESNADAVDLDQAELDQVDFRGSTRGHTTAAHHRGENRVQAGTPAR